MRHTPNTPSLNALKVVCCGVVMVLVGGCTTNGTDFSDYANSYGVHVSALETASADHQKRIDEATSLDDIRTEEARYAALCRSHAKDMGHVLDDMGTCAGQGGGMSGDGQFCDSNTNSAVNGRLDDFRRDIDDHFAAIKKSASVDAAKAVEKSHTTDANTLFEAMHKDHGVMVGMASSFMCDMGFDHGHAR